MIDLTLNGFLRPAIIGLQAQFGTVIETDAQNKGGLSTAQTDNNVAMPFSLMRPIAVGNSDSTSNIEFDAKLLITGDTPITLTLGEAVYEGCRVTITNKSAQTATITSTKIEGVAGGEIYLDGNSVLEMNYTESDGWVYSNSMVGEIKVCTDTDIPSGWLCCDGTEYDVTQYPRLAKKLIKLPFNAGVADGKFRVPDLRKRVPEGASDNLGVYIEAGLPNIVGSFESIGQTDPSGAIYIISNYNGSYPVDSQHRKNFGFDASKGEAKTDGNLKTEEEYKVYGKSDTVQPNTFTVNYIIKY